MIKTVIFDADGVLVTPKEMFSQQYSREFNVPYQEIDRFFMESFGPCLVGKADLKEVIQPYASKWGWHGTIDELIAYWFKAEHFIDQRLIEDVKLLKDRGTKLYVATNQDKYRAAYMVNEMGFGQLFDDLFASAHFGCRKPDQEFFRQLYEKMNDVEKREILFWDDKEENVLAARQFGIQAEQYTSYEDFAKKMKEYLGSNND